MAKQQTATSQPCRFGITGLYLSFVYGIGRFLRLSVADMRLRIPTEDLPSTRRLVQLCQDIYVARAQGAQHI